MLLWLIFSCPYVNQLKRRERVPRGSFIYNLSCDLLTENFKDGPDKFMLVSPFVVLVPILGFYKLINTTEVALVITLALLTVTTSFTSTNVKLRKLLRFDINLTLT
mgnify:CR=1 FL=1